MKKILTALCAAMFWPAPCSAQEIVFDHNFDNGTPGDLSDSGALGTPAVGTISAPGGFVSSETVFNPGLANERTATQAYTTGNNGSFNAIVVETDQAFNDVGTPAGNFLTANLSAPAAVTGTLGAGLATTIDFSLGSFGGSGATPFKYIHIIGRSTEGAEVFQLLFRATGIVAQREFFARELGQDSTTFTNGTFSSLEGTEVLSSASNAFNSTITDRAPSFQLDVNVTFDANGWNVTALPQGGSFGPADPTVTGLGIASGATDLATIEFFTSHNASVNSQNKGFWLDNLVVATGVMVDTPDALGDLNSDGVVDCLDIDSYIGNLGLDAGEVAAGLDLVADGTIDSLDVAFLIENLVVTTNGATGTAVGDFNCDGEVNVLGDAFILVANLNDSVGSYSLGDANLDGTVNVLGDAFTLVANLGFSNDQ